MATKHLKIKVFGVVQGVGFRPFVRNLAVKYGIIGSVCNKGPYVDIEAQGGEQLLAAFLHDLKKRRPARAEIRKIETESREIKEYSGFEIIESKASDGEVFPSPDIAICDDCARELFDKTDRRYLHPFINCTACGPRLTILTSMPYDRVRTSMSEFEMCPDCREEYKNPKNRRFHAQPVCCNSCGPTLKLLKAPENLKFESPVSAVRKVIMSGGIAAVKGIGGFHLCCDAKNTDAANRLRRLKNRPSKPFAVMAKDINTAKRETFVDSTSAKILQSPQKPILLLEKKDSGQICPEVAPDNPNLGLMLPYAPVQLMIFNYTDGQDFTDCLVMTSGNVSGEPICSDDEEAYEELSPLCDIILSNNRDILLRADDSVMSVYKDKEYMIRRSRGFAPLPFNFIKKVKTPIFAAGGELKNVFGLTNADKFYLSAHIGDLSGEKSLSVLEDSYTKMKKLLRIEPEAAVCDLHPGYNSSAFAKSLELPVIEVQHHFAHIASCMVENRLDGEVIGVAFDGTGYGNDGTIWGGEFIKASYTGFERLGSISPFKLAGGDAAARNCWRPAIGVLVEAFGEQAAKEYARKLRFCSEKELSVQINLIRNQINCVTTTSAGRLFDAVSAILGLCSENTYEGEGAVKVESAAKRYAKGCNKAVSLPDTSTNDIIKILAEQVTQGKDADMLAYSFHCALAKLILNTCKMCSDKTGLDRVALSGGVFSNSLLLSLSEKLLKENGFKVFIHSLSPCNDGGIALGQAAVAASLIMDN